MKKTLIALLVITLVGCSSRAIENNRIISVGEPTVGIFEDNVYTNDFIGLTLSVNEKHFFMNSESLTDEEVARGAVILGVVGETKNKETRDGNIMRIFSTPQGSFDSVEAYYDFFFEGIEYSIIKIDGVDFYKAEPQDQGSYTTNQYVNLSNGYFVTYMFYIVDSSSKKNGRQFIEDVISSIELHVESIDE